MAVIRCVRHPPDFRAYRKQLRLYFCSSMASQAHASRKNLQTGARVALLGLVVNVVLAFAKIVAGLVGHAYVLIADGIESALDVGGSIVIWGGLTVAARPPDSHTSVRSRQSRANCCDRGCTRRIGCRA